MSVVEEHFGRTSDIYSIKHVYCLSVDYLRLYMNFFPEDMKVHIRVKEGVAREVLHINAHNPLKEPLFLTLQSKEFFSSDSVK